MLENQILVVQKLFQWEVHDLKWIHENYQSSKIVSNHDRLQKLVNNELSGKTSGHWQFVANKER